MISGRHSSRCAGFSLVEISIVLAVISVVLSGMLPYVTESTRAQDADQTLERMDAIENAIIAHYSEFGRLPCPADIDTYAVSNTNFGRAGTGAVLFDGTCSNAIAPDASFITATTAGGGVPTKTLGLPDEYGFDGWGRRFSYHVVLEATNAATIDGSTSPTGITVRDAADTPRATNAIYVLISHGPNGHGGFTRAPGVQANSGAAVGTSPDQFENCEAGAGVCPAAVDTIFYQRPLGYEVPGNESTLFDDIVRYKLESQIDRAAVNNEQGLWARSGNNIYNTNSGNVGIGQNAPTIKFEVTPPSGVNSIARFTGDDADFNEIRFLNTSIAVGDPGRDWAIIQAGSAPVPATWGGVANTPAPASLILHQHGAGPRLSIGPDGNVGIGIPNATTRLDVRNGLMNLAPGAISAAVPAGADAMTITVANAGAAGNYSAGLMVNANTNLSVGVQGSASSTNSIGGNFTASNASGISLRVSHSLGNECYVGSNTHGISCTGPNAFATSTAGSNAVYGVISAAGGQGGFFETTNAGSTGLVARSSLSGFSCGIGTGANSIGCSGPSYFVTAAAGSNTVSAVASGANSNAVTGLVSATGGSGGLFSSSHNGSFGLTGRHALSGLNCVIGTSANSINCNAAPVLPSDVRLKKDIDDLPVAYGLDALMQLRPVTFNWKDERLNQFGKDLGFIAQEIEKVLPEVIREDDMPGEDAEHPKGFEGKVKTMAYDKMTAPMVLAIQQLKHEVDAIKAGTPLAATDASDKPACDMGGSGDDGGAVKHLERMIWLQWGCMLVFAAVIMVLLRRSKRR